MGLIAIKWPFIDKSRYGMLDASLTWLFIYILNVCVKNILYVCTHASWSALISHLLDEFDFFYTKNSNFYFLQSNVSYESKIIITFISLLTFNLQSGLTLSSDGILGPLSSDLPAEGLDLSEVPPADESDWEFHGHIPFYTLSFVLQVVTRKYCCRRCVDVIVILINGTMVMDFGIQFCL